MPQFSASTLFLLSLLPIFVGCTFASLTQIESEVTFLSELKQPCPDLPASMPPVVVWPIVPAADRSLLDASGVLFVETAAGFDLSVVKNKEERISIVLPDCRRLFINQIGTDGNVAATDNQWQGLTQHGEAVVILLEEDGALNGRFHFDGVSYWLHSGRHGSFFRSVRRGSLPQLD